MRIDGQDITLNLNGFSISCPTGDPIEVFGSSITILGPGNVKTLNPEGFQDSGIRIGDGRNGSGGHTVDGVTVTVGPMISESRILF